MQNSPLFPLLELFPWALITTSQSGIAFIKSHMSFILEYNARKGYFLCVKIMADSKLTHKTHSSFNSLETQSKFYPGSLLL